jgi:hypothetical protein
MANLPTHKKSTAGGQLITKRVARADQTPDEEASEAFLFWFIFQK